MTNQEILEMAIKKAIDGGWKFDLPNWSVESNGADGLVVGSLIEFEGDEWFNEDYPTLYTANIIFNHDFAKALWGDGMSIDTPRQWQKLDEPMDNGREYLMVVYPSWQYHIREMVIAEDPIQYLGANL